MSNSWEDVEEEESSSNASQEFDEQADEELGFFEVDYEVEEVVIEDEEDEIIVESDSLGEEEEELVEGEEELGFFEETYHDESSSSDTGPSPLHDNEDYDETSDLFEVDYEDNPPQQQSPVPPRRQDSEQDEGSGFFDVTPNEEVAQVPRRQNPYKHEHAQQDPIPEAAPPRKSMPPPGPSQRPAPPPRKPSSQRRNPMPQPLRQPSKNDNHHGSKESGTRRSTSSAAAAKEEPTKPSSSSRSRCAMITCCVLLALLVVGAGIAVGAIFLFDLDVEIPYLKEEDDDDTSRGVSTNPLTNTPTSSPVSSNPGTLSPNGTKSWQAFGNSVYGQNATDEFGSAVALANQGNLLVVGAPLDENGAGSIQTFVWDVDSLEWDATVLPDIVGSTRAGHFGDSLAVSTKGDIVAACSSTSDQGSIVQVFQKITGGDTWVQVQDAIPRTGRGSCPLALSADGLTVAFGSKWHWSAGIVQVYKLDQTDQWGLHGQELRAETLQDLSMADGWGESVALSADGNVLAATASGGAYLKVLALDAATTKWVPKGQTLKVEKDQHSSKLSSRMPVSLSDDGNIVAMGVPQFGGTSNPNVGSVQVYRFDNTTNEWRLLGSNIVGSQSHEQFGFSLALSSDGLSLVASGVGQGSEGQDDTTTGDAPSSSVSAGVVRIYKYDDSQNDWKQVMDDIHGQAPGDEWGYAVTISSDGNVVAAGGRFHNGGNGEHSGQVQVYKFT